MTDVEIRTPVPLRTLHGIEMAAVGTWKAQTGTTTFTAEDFAAAVAALECPGVRNPVIKLGHAEKDSDSGVRWDGEPAVGWVANLRIDGPKIVGDFTGMPAWLADADENGLSVLAAGYPDRSIEIYRPFECQVGHLHPAVITAVSLLGIYAPGVGVLKSMQDVYAAFTQAGSSSQALARLGATWELQTTVTRAAAEERRELTDIEKRSGVDFAKVAEQWDTALDNLLDKWPDISEAQRDELAAQIASAVDNHPDMLGAITVDTEAAAALLLSSMRSLAEQSAAAQVAEAASQGVSIEMPEIADDLLTDVAQAVAGAMGASTASLAGRTAAQALGTGDGALISTTTLEHLAGLTDRFLQDELGGALSTAQARGRYAALFGYDGPVDLYASEINDARACAPCKSIDGRHFDSLDDAQDQYGAGKYSGCLGGSRCRGQLIAVFGTGTKASAAERLPTTVRMTLGGTMPPDTGGAVKASVSVEDISRKYYESAGYSMYITAMHVDPLELIAADDSTGKFFRVPVELSGDQFVFGEPQEVTTVYQDVKTAASAIPVRFDSRKAALAAAGKNEDGTDRIAPDVSPAGAAIRKAVSKAEAPAAVIETEVPAAAPQTPDADPAAGPITTTPKEASVDAAKMREALGLDPGASDDEVRAALASQFATPQTEPTTDPLSVLTAQLPAGERPILVDPENYKSLLSMAVKGERAFAEVTKARGKTVLEQAAREGRFPVARLSVYQEMWDKNPEETEAYIKLMPKNTVPTLAAGVLGQEISQNESDMAYSAMYGTEG